MVRTRPDRVVATGITGADPFAPEADSKAEIAVLDRDGMLVGRWSIGLPSVQRPATPTFGARAGNQVVWTGDGVGLIEPHSRALEPDGEGPERESVLTYRFVDPDGIARAPVELTETRCADCTLVPAASFHGGRVQVLYAALPAAPEAELGPMGFVVLSPSGEMERSGTLDWLEAHPQAALGRFAPSGRGNGLVVAGVRGEWLVDAMMEPTAGPIALPAHPAAPAAVDWNVDAGSVAAAWAEEAAILFRRFEPDGTAKSEAALLSFGQAADAVFDTGDALAAVFRDGSATGARRYFAAAGADDRKLGGDLPLAERTVSPARTDGGLADAGGDAPGGLEPGRAASSALLLGSGGNDFVGFLDTGAAIVRFEVACR